MRKRILRRGNLRDIVILLAGISAVFFPISHLNLIVSLVVLALGSSFNFITKGTLIRNTVLCDRGVYRICRHPYYLSNFIVDVSFCLLSGNIFLVLVYPFLFFWAYGPTFEEEETNLSRRYPERYAEFLLQVPQIFPRASSFAYFSEFLEEFSLQRITRNEMVRMTRFWFLAMMLLFIHEIQEEGMTVLSIKPVDKDMAVIVGVGVLLGIGSMVIAFFQESPVRELEG